MTVLEAKQQPSSAEYSRLALRYVGEAATDYEGLRVGRKWRAEDEAAEELLRYVDHGAPALDIPVGTGRLLPLMKARGFATTGLDISPDMLSIARRRAGCCELPVDLRVADIRNIPFADNHFQLVTCVRFLNLIDSAGVELAVREMRRVTGDKLLLGVRYLPSRTELKISPNAAVRMAMRAIHLPLFHARRSGLFYHRENFVRQMFERHRLEILHARHVERRFDGTDYVFFLLKKQAEPNVGPGANRVERNLSLCSAAR